jgi:hypothetical protein
LVAEKFQEYLSKEASAVPCAKVRKAAAYVKKPKTLESEERVCCWDPARRRRLRYGMFCSCCGTAVASDANELKRHL